MVKKTIKQLEEEIARKELDGNEADFIKKASKYVRMATPNGIVDADRMITFRVPSLGDPIDAYVMDQDK
jgi:hypothetical protein